MKALSYKIMAFIAALSAVAGFVVGCGNDYNPQAGSLGNDSSSDKAYKKQAESKVRLDPRAVTEMLYQGIFWRSMDLPGAQGYIDLIARKGLEGIRDAAVGMINDSTSGEFRTRIEPKIYQPGGDRQVLEHMTFNFWGSLPREDHYVNDYKKYTDKIRQGKSAEVARDLLKDIRFYRRFAYVPPTYNGPAGTPATPYGVIQQPGGGYIYGIPKVTTPVPQVPQTPTIPQVPIATAPMAPNPQPAPAPDIPNLGGPADMDAEARNWWNGLPPGPVEDVHLKIYWIMNLDGTPRPGFDKSVTSTTIAIGEAAMFDVNPKNGSGRDCRWDTWPVWKPEGDTVAFQINQTGPFHLKARAVRPGTATFQAFIDGKPSQVISITAQ
jgi:hypothetical protein